MSTAVEVLKSFAETRNVLTESPAVRRLLDHALTLPAGPMALAAIERASKMAPGSAAVFLHRGGVLGDWGKPDDAMASYDLAIKLEPDSFYARTARILRGSQ